MAISTWQPGKLYLPGALVSPTAVEGATDTVIPNAYFESGDTGWTKGTGWSITTDLAFGGTYGAKYVGVSGGAAATVVNSTKLSVAPGKAITAQCMVHQGGSADGQANAAVILEWYDSGDVLLSTSTGNSVSTGATGVWRLSTVSGTAPSGAAKVSIGATAYNNTDWGAFPLTVDNFRWNYVTGTAPNPLVYKAVQTEAGTSGTVEPTWPTTPAATVVDNEITWEAVTVGTITWEASSILTSGSSEPTWPTESGAYVSDGNIAWETIPLRITDENCPHSKVVAIAASKVFAGDTDVVRFCVTLNARDWTSNDDAGFLPSGLQQKGEVGVTAMGVYRGNLAVWSPSTFQVWQVDPDPAAMALLDAMEGIGSVHQHAVQPVSDDLFFLSALGVRTVGIAEGTNNLASGDVGVPIDTLVQPEMNAVDAEPIATYYPGAGQYWLAFRPLTIAAALLAGQFLLTSPIYPVEATDGVAWEAAALGGRTQAVQTDSWTNSVAILNGELESIFKASEPQVDSWDAQVSILSGDLDDIYQASAPQEDAWDAQVAILSGELELALVKHTNPDEGLDWTPSATGGSTS